MGKHKTHPAEFDDEFFAQLDFLRQDYDNALETIGQQKKDILKLLALLIEKDIPVPDSIVDRYIKRVFESLDIESNDDAPEDLPFN
ncbi:hypothetical protein [Eubacterium sp.]|uniref:hypothetical protein n=1 Tax=Eubacterium sp. TaxID=142586 RepID=UPI0026DF98CC|nr:hypothetical protein [Eubacterium sp.]MDO5434726.1 hypothetical protein [Eubacterium sp.]